MSILRYLAALAVVLTVGPAPISAQPAGEDGRVRADQNPLPPADKGLQPFGSNLFLGNFRKTREDGVNPEYVVMPGDRVAVNTWGTIDINGVFVVDTQGNVFLPGLGPVKLAGVKNRNLTTVVRQVIGQRYRRFEVYTNLLTTAPVAVFVTGGVVNPGRYAGVPSDSVLFFLDEAGGIDPALGSYRKISILRGGASVAEVDLYDFLLEGRLPTVQFADGDTILVQRRGPVVRLLGEVSAQYLVEFDTERVTGADAMAVIPKAARANAVTVRGTRGGAPFLRTFSTDAFRAVELVNGDSIQFRDDDRADTILVNLEGEFRGSSVLAVRRGARLIDVLNYVRVDRRLSDVASVHLRRPSIARAQKQAIEDSLIRLERSALLATSDTEKEAQIRAQEAQLMQSFIKSARSVQPLGRVVTTLRGRQLNLLLRDGDTVVIPPVSNVVQVSGEVQMSHAVVYGAGLRVRDYIRRAGGFTPRSDQDKVIILHASAAVTIAGPEALVRQGDSILVPPKVERKLLQNAADVTQVLYQIAVAAAVVLAI